ncbi:YHYH domain-containing protein [Vibrio ruber]|nr:YHYH domain-containing protein [Vibrio ruber]WNJ97193.1 YHYH domain-containing protein [Vibrio ruber]
MKKIIIFLFTMSMSCTALAHSGGTNSSGCHQNHKTGDYHCHNRK